MNANFFESLVTSTDYLNWDRYYKQLPAIDLSETDRQRTRNSIDYLRNLFGEDFLRNSFANGSSLFSLFINAAPRAKQELISLADSLKGLEGVENFRELVSQIGDHRANGAISVLQTAARFSRSGFEVSLDPTVRVSTPSGIVREKVPDIRLLDPETGEVAFVEVSRLRRSTDQDKSSRAFRAIWVLVDSLRDMVPGALDDITNPKWMRVYVRILRVLEEDELQTALMRIRELAQEVLVTSEHRELQIEDMLEMIISPAHDHSRAKEWAAERNMTEFVESPVITLNEIQRVQGKIFEKMQQLPCDKPGIVVITTDENLLFPFYPFAEIIHGVAEKTIRFPHVFAVVLTHACLDGSEESLVAEIGEHIYARHTTEALCTHHTLIVRNLACAKPVSRSTELRIQNAFSGNWDWKANQ
jgi:hypothetical protein